jgi:hypothetical protein
MIDCGESKSFAAPGANLCKEVREHSEPFPRSTFQTTFTAASATKFQCSGLKNRIEPDSGLRIGGFGIGMSERI